MATYEIKKIDNYILGLTNKAQQLDPSRIIMVCKQGTSKNASLMGGRAGLKFMSDNSEHQIAIKTYKRGGFFSHFNSNYYWDTGQNRAELEMEWYQKAAQLGVNTPETLFWVKQTGFTVYKCWMGMYYLENTETYLSMIQKDFIRSFYFLPNVCSQVARLVRGKLWHVDLHPANIIIDAENVIYLTDFDGARTFNGEKNVLAEKYIDRWKRYARKYKLPVEIEKSFRQELYARI